ncbi:MAG: hypothetical protein EXR28_08350 [Betaproteobacteria bacterium]|nr:hypothetical protein [Betaproteobacteria bacterium]
MLAILSSFANVHAQSYPAKPLRMIVYAPFTDKVFAPFAFTIMGGSPEDLAATARATRRTAEELVKIANLKLE